MIGKTLAGRYRLLRPLGKGGFGQTYLAEDTLMLPGDRQCVVKHFQPPDNITQAALKQAKKSFEREARVLSKLGRDCLQIPSLLAYFEEENQFFLVQELIEGQNLEAEIQPNKKLPEAEVIELLEKVLEILSFVHQKRVIHRDIKPSNIMRRVSDGVLFLIDFGSVKQQIPTQIVDEAGQTKSRFAYQTPGFTPREQEQLNPQRASDLYALGMTAIFALTGICPHELTENESTREIDWRSYADVNPQLADFLDRLVRYDYRQRYPSAVEALQELKQLKNSRKPPQLKFSGFKKIAATTALLLAVGVGGYYIWQQNQAISLSTYDSNEHGLTMKYPSTWQIDRVNDYAIAVRLKPPAKEDDGSIEVTVETEDIDPNTSLGQYADLAIASITEYLPEAKIINSEPIELNNKPAHQIVYSGTNKGLKNKYMQILLLDKNKAYIFTYVAPEERYQNFITTVEETMIPSLGVESRGATRNVERQSSKLL